MSAGASHVLEFRVGEETYCVSIDCVREVVDAGDVTAVPGSPPHVRGVLDLRGRTTSVVDPAVVFDVDGGGDGHRIVVFDPAIVADLEAAGWLVEEVYGVRPLDPEAVDPTPDDWESNSVRGIVRRDDGFAIWVDPGAIRMG